MQIVGDLAPAFASRALSKNRIEGLRLAHSFILLHELLRQSQGDRDLAVANLAVAQVRHDGWVDLVVLGDRVGDAALPRFRLKSKPCRRTRRRPCRGRTKSRASGAPVEDQARR